MKILFFKNLKKLGYRYLIFNKRNKNDKKLLDHFKDTIYQKMLLVKLIKKPI